MPKVVRHFVASPIIWHIGKIIQTMTHCQIYDTLNPSPPRRRESRRCEFLFAIDADVSIKQKMSIHPNAKPAITSRKPDGKEEIMTSIFMVYEDQDNSCSDPDCCGGPFPYICAKLFSSKERAIKAGFTEDRIQELKVDSDEWEHVS